MQKKQAVIIVTDTERRDLLGCYGGENVRTPSLDRFAGEDIVLDRAYCCDPVCTPARGHLHGYLSEVCATSATDGPASVVAELATIRALACPRTRPKSVRLRLQTALRPS